MPACVGQTDGRTDGQTPHDGKDRAMQSVAREKRTHIS